MEIAVLAGGCFWGVEELLRKVPGVLETEVGYSGGTIEHPKYEQVKTGKTGHAEAIEITYDPKLLSYSRLLELFFQLHDPTTLNRQGNDIGTQYRSAIFVRTPGEREAAEDAIKRENESGRWKRPVTTTVEDLTTFYPAEDYHQDYLQKNPGAIHAITGVGRVLGNHVPAEAQEPGSESFHISENRRNHDQREKCRTHHAADDRGAERAALIRNFVQSDRDRHHS
jgi:methionine-S-sulfoxide reductase